MDTVGRVSIGVVNQLTCSKEEGQVLVVIEAPDPMAARWFQEVVCLKSSHEPKISTEDLVDEASVVIYLINANLAHAVQKDEKV